VCAAVAAENGTQQDLVRGTVESLVDAHVTDDILADDAAVHGPTNRTTTVDKIVSDYYKMASTVDDPQGGK
jgi:L-asparaginase II